LSGDCTRDNLPSESLLLESAEELYENAPCGYLTTTGEGRIVKVNRTFLEWLGYERDELIGDKHFVDLLTVGGRLFYETHIRLLLRMQKTVSEIALDIRCKNGRVLPVLINARQKRNAADEPLFNQFTVFNASERRRYERDLLAARDLLRITLASIGDAVVATDGKGRITFTNPVADRLCGWKEEAVLGRSVEEVLTFIYEDSRIKLENPITQALRTRTIIEITEHPALLTTDGRCIPIDDSASPMRDMNGEVIGAVLVFRDVSEQRKAATALKQAHEQLAKRAEELRRSNEDLSQFAHVASHDLRSPLNTISQFAQLLQQRYGPQLGEGQQLLHHLTNAAKRMSNLVEDLLLYAQVSSDGTSVAYLNDANLQLARALDNLNKAITDSGASVTYDPLPQVHVDSTSLLQVFQNLVGNAIYYRRAAPPRVHISSQEQSDCWLFSCKDNGIGIAPEFYLQIFEPFKRLHGADLPGTGIGLAVCKRIVERYKGKIWVESELDVGSTFYFTLPKSPKTKASADPLPQA
jgi:PAS domain S-box-containing protein